MNKTNKYALVTGASSGIGWYLSIELASRGYSIVAVSIQPEQLNELKQELEETYPVHVQIIDCDLAKEGAAEKIYEICHQKSLTVEVVINNAGILVYGETIGAEIEQVRNILQLHMTTPAMLCRLFGEQMAKAGKGYILNVSSISAVMPYPTISLYGPTKTFLRKFTRALRLEMNGKGVNVTCLLPGATATALYDPQKVNIPLAIKMGVMKTPEKVAKCGVKALFRNKAERIPGFLNKLTMFIVLLIPYWLIGFIYKRMVSKN